MCTEFSLGVGCFSIVRNCSGDKLYKTQVKLSESFQWQKDYTDKHGCVTGRRGLQGSPRLSAESSQSPITLCSPTPLFLLILLTHCFEFPKYNFHFHEIHFFSSVHHYKQVKSVQFLEIIQEICS